MFTPEDYFADFSQLLDREKIWLDPSVSFASICRRLGVSRHRFDRFLQKDLGFRGEEILAVYRRSADKMA